MAGTIAASRILRVRRYSSAVAAEPRSQECLQAGAGLTLHLLASPAQVMDLRPEWDELLERMPRPSPFLSWSWISTWIEHFTANSRLWVLVARDGAGGLQGVAPLHLVRRGLPGWPARTLEFLGYRGSTVCADHLDFLAAGTQRRQICAALLEEIIRRRSDWDVMVLADLAEDSLLPELAPGLARDGALAMVPAEVCYYCSLPSDFATLHAGTKRSRLNLRNRSKRLAQQGAVRFVSSVPVAELESNLQELIRLHGLARRHRGQSNSFARPAYVGFHRSLMQKLAGEDRLYFARVELNGAACAVFYGFHLGGVLYFYQSGYDPGLARFGVGTLQMAAVLEDAIARLHAREFDFLRGAEEYKTYWTSTARHTRTLRLWNPSPRARLSHRVWRGRQRLERWKHLIWKRAKSTD